MKTYSMFISMLLTSVCHASPRFVDVTKLEFNYSSNHGVYMTTVKEDGVIIWQDTSGNRGRISTAWANYDELVGLASTFNIPLQYDADKKEDVMHSAIKLTSLPERIAIDPQDLECNLARTWTLQHPRVQIKYKGQVVISDSVPFNLYEQSILEQCVSELGEYKKLNVVFLKKSAIALYGTPLYLSDKP